MRTLILTALLGLSLPLTAQAARFIKVDIVNKSMKGHVHRHADKAKAECSQDGPNEIKMRVPVSLAKGVLEMAAESEVKVNGKERPGIKVDQLVKLLENAKPGDILLEITTDKGDLVKVTLE